MREWVCGDEGWERILICIQALLMLCHLLPLFSVLLFLPPPSFLSSTSSFTSPPSSFPAPSPCRRGGKYNHCRIHTKSEGGKTKFYLIDQMCFDSIYDLIVYYKVKEVEEEGGGRRVVEEERWRRRAAEDCVSRQPWHRDG